uniref:Midasin n=1 Tax=Elaeis guineensis var. tenera TaxID=51953 RepID=A0A8N4II94_ELAGV|nr:LOW QUALITY PROTEIN: midasin [Elaeis guineensis]
MSFDGSFVCEAGLQRFLARCPNLRLNSRLVALSQKGGVLTVDDVVAVIADPFLHPSYTIPIMGCFRPLCRKIVERVVAKLSSVPSLESESNEVVEEIGEDDLHVIDFYVERGRGLRLHELASLAFCLTLDLAPFLLGSLLSYFKFSPPPFGRLLLLRSASKFTEKDVKQLLDSVRVSYRFLVMEPKVFAELWDWSCFLDVPQQTCNIGLVDGKTSSDALDITWCSVQILSVVLRISDRATENFGLAPEEAFMCLLRWEEFCKDTSLEKAGWYLQAPEMENGGCLIGTTKFTPCLESFDNVSFINSSIHSRDLESGSRSCRNKVSCDVLSGSHYVLTPTVKKSFEMVLMALSQKWPVLLHGPAGGGKTALINKLAQLSGNRVLFVHMDEQMDSKTLVGSYICSEQPGEFRWQHGSLSQAILKGFWVVFEDIDKAPNEIQSIILPLLEGSSSFVTGHGEAISVADSFRLFATVSTSTHEVAHAIEGSLPFSVLWRKVMVATASSGDVLDILNAWYPSLECISSKLIETFEKVNSLASYRLGGIQDVGVVSAGTFSRFSLRDLLKWCRRIAGLDLNFSGLGLSASDRQIIYQEAVDIFAASLSSFENRLLMMREIARIWGIVENVYPPSKPVFQTRRSDLQVGRVVLQCSQAAVVQPKRPFVGIRSALHVLERIACSVKNKEPVLLVGETGTGKTTLVQNLAMRLGQPLTVMNLSQQSDVADLLGGFKPTDARSICVPLYHEFKQLFCKTFSGKDNEALLRHYEIYAIEKNWKKLLHAFQKSVEFVQKRVYRRVDSGCGSKRKRPLSEDVLQDWESFSLRLNAARKQIGAAAGMSFTFVEGAFITALRSGFWILLDEINLAPPETLQRISGVLDGDKGTLCLTERGDIDYIDRHPSFRLFACMNPATDAGKRELPYSFRSRFTEYFVDDVLDDEDLTLFVNQYMDEINTRGDMSSRIVRFYKAAKSESEERLQDGANQKPQFSLRSLARALEYTKKAEKNFGFQRALYDGFCMFFLTSLDGSSAKIMNKMIVSYLLGGTVPPSITFDAYFSEKSKPVDVSDSSTFIENYVLTRSVKEHLKNLARAVYIKRYPVLLQGPTSSGKTSLVHYLASVTGHEFVRINNHEHTDLQEYFGSYITDSFGRLQFQEGVLVKAVRKGHWIVLDELNLAPSDVLEALNRLLDDNRELFVPELQETVSAHPDFMLFATQNPPTLYGGRKMLSRAFRNRFLEIHVDEIPEDELTIILENRCKIPASYAMKMVEVMKALQLHRQNSKVFAGKHGFITPRDLFRWANRFRMFGKSYEDLARDGYLLLAERLRDENEKNVVQETLERCLRVKLIIEDLYKAERGQGDAVFEFSRIPGGQENFGNITWTKSMWRLYFLIVRCYELREPVLLVGETGGGKTTVCQLLSIVLRARLHTLNCHQYTETSDFIGGFYPVRDRSRLVMEFKHGIERVKQSKIFLHFAGDVALSSDISQGFMTISQLNEILNNYNQNAPLHPDVTQQDVEAFEQIKLDLLQLKQKWQTIFLWQDGPLVQAMKDGDLFLVDEISLADDSVLERLNSVLEPERKLSLAEKGGSVLEKITAHPSFFILATMNPGGDYGKKELSPALRNRFTEIWVPPVNDVNELKSIAIERFVKSEILFLADCMLKFWQWFNQLQTGRQLTVRDLLSWISFINVTEGSLGSEYAFIHGVFLVLLDGLSLGTGISKNDAKLLREHSLSFLLKELKEVSDGSLVDSRLFKMENYGWGDDLKLADNLFSNDLHSEDLFGIEPFYIAKGSNECKHEGFEFLAPTTSRNVLRVLRAMQLSKPVLLEGSPGVGKTSLIVALAEYSGHTVVRINLSEQTDMMDLLGSDLPVQGETGMEFSWSDGILLQALKNGSWVLLDELNLAPQSVLEGLNAILDHRAEVFIPELGLTFKCPPSFRIFACQNPSCQGGGRKGLPKSFLNRFTKVYVDELAADDYLFICQSRFPSIPQTVLSKLISFNNCLYEDTMVYRKYGQEGSPWEFNLRDVIRSCQIIEGAPANAKVDSFLNIVYLQRMRTATDRKEVLKLYEAVFGLKPSITPTPRLRVNPKYLIMGNACVERNHFQPAKILKSQINMLPGICQSLEAALHCIQQRWLCIFVGPSSSGKTSLVRLLAQLTGNELTELSLSSGTDVSELLGSFEQYNSYRSCKAVISQVEHYVDEYFSLRLEVNWMDLINSRKDLFAKWFSFLAAKKNYSCMSASASAETLKTQSHSLLSPLIEIIEELKHDLEMFHLPVSWSCKDLEKSLKTVLELQRKKMMQPSANFEWVAGDLIRAIDCGEWIVLDNANLCNPTVLDRINSLVEPDGSIIINECGLVDGRPVVLHAHPKFRMFLTVDPKHGEVSRAMRNRGLEIFLMQPNWLLDGEGSDDCMGSEIIDVKSLLTFSGIPSSKLILAMSNAHMYAKAAGLRLGVRITLLELTRWIQLFQQLLMNGNQLTWSLQLSWEHTYLSALGEAEGTDTIMQAKVSYLSNTEWYKLDPLSGCSLSLPGGWPVPHTLRNFLWYSKEACVKQNCMYLEFLGAKCASYKFNFSSDATFPFDKISKDQPSVIPANMLQVLLFPNALGKQNVKSNIMPVEFDLALVNQMLFIAANWTIEQATENDLVLYILWFKWYSSMLEPYCHFFKSFSTILEQERDHPIWNCILDGRREVVSYHKINIDERPLPLLSKKLVELGASDGNIKNVQKHLDNAIQCVNLLRLTYKQWNSETDYSYGEKSLCYLLSPVLNSLRCLESEVLKIVAESKKLLQIYSNILEYHLSFWKSITSSHFEYLVVIWSCLRKEAMKLQRRFPEAVGALLSVSLNLNHISTWSLHTEEPTLWIYGGHPILPSSADVFYKLQHLLSFCNAVWPRKKLLKQNFSDSHLVMEAVLSTNIDLRHLAMQGVCMSSYITTKGDQETANAVAQLEELHQRLLNRFEYERKNIELVFGSTDRTKTSTMGGSTTTCCSFSSDILCRQSGFSSWLVIVPLFDIKSFSLDIKLLKEFSKCISANAGEVHQVLSKTSNLLQHALEYSLDFTSRSPMDFTPHQMILWILDAWDSVDSVKTKFANFLLEMWFKYHSSLWNHWSGPLEISSGSDYGESCHLVYPTRTATIDMIIQCKSCVKDYDVNCLKLRVVSRCLWQDTPLQGDLIGVLHSAADSLFKQILLVHEKSFDKDAFSKIKSILCSLLDNGITQEELQFLRSLLSSSSHGVLTSLEDSLIEPLLKELYFEYPSHDSLYNLGCAWLHIGALRFHLLLNSDGPDPAMKYAFKYSQILEKIALLELEIKVRLECEQLAGRISTRDDEKQRVSSLQSLEEERNRLQAKVVFRPEPQKYKSLRSVCADFRKLASSCMELSKNLKCNADRSLMINVACNWQVTSASFIKRLSEEFAEYIDLIQPVQVAVYEMKLGLSMVVSSALEGEYLKKVEEDNIERILATIYSYMQFPRGLPVGGYPVELIDRGTENIALTYASASILAVDFNLLNKLVIISSEISPDKSISLVQLQTTIHHIMLIHAAHHVCCSLVIDKASFLLLDDIFGHFTSLWMNMKSQKKAKEDDEAQLYKFRPRSIKIEDILVGDMSQLSDLDSDGPLTLENGETLMQQEFTEMRKSAKEDETKEEEWDLIFDNILKSMVLVHNELFGSSDLVEEPGIGLITDEQRLHSFMESYRLGTRIIKDLQAFHSSILDENLMPEHLLRICLEYEQTLGISCQPAHVYNIYKDSNASVMHKMVKPLTVIQEQIKSFLNEWPDHPGLQKILDTTDTLLAIPLNTPLSKALLGLQLLVGRAQSLQENASRFSLKNELQPIYDLVSSWQKLELDCWPALLDDVQKQYEINAGKLWFPLHAVLHRKLSGDAEADSLFTIQSIEEFIQTSSVGEFKKRLHLLLSFHGQLKHGINLKAYSSPNMAKNLNILYNAFGYYVQFMPLVLEHIEAGRRCVEKDLKEYLKLFHWEHPHNYSSIDNFRRTRHKIWKLIQKFNDVLQQPVMIILNQEAALVRDKVPSWLEHRICNEVNMEVLQFPVDLVKLRNTERFVWYGNWRNKAESALQGMCDGSIPGVDFLESKGLVDAIRQALFSESTGGHFKQAWEDGWTSLENICIHAAEFAHIWKHETKNLKKRRALGDLLKALEGCGLSRHRSIITELEVQSGQPSNSFLQPSYDVLHLLLKECNRSCKDINIGVPSHAEKPAGVNGALKWEDANQYYFKSLAMMQQFRQICLNFNKDLSLEQVNRAASFLDHLIILQHEQRYVAYGVSEQLKNLRQLFHLLNSAGFGGNISVSPNQNAVLKCIWLQKQLLDSLLAMSKDVNLLLGRVKNSHMSTCTIVRVEADVLSALIDKFIPSILKSKESLDEYLIGSDRSISTAAHVPFVVTEQMEQLVMCNFQIINNIKEDIQTLVLETACMRSLKGILLDRLKELINKGNMLMEDFNSEIEASSQLAGEENPIFMEVFSKLGAVYADSFAQTNKLMNDAFGKLDVLHEGHTLVQELSAENITLWKDLFESYMMNLHLDLMYNALTKTVVAASKLVNCAAHRKPEVCTQVQTNLKHLHVLLGLIVTFAEGILSEFLDAHGTIAEMTHVLAHIFALLFSKGLGSVEEPTENTACDGTQDASGTGMGEGEGINDVSDQIENEAQLLGSSEKQDELENSEKVPSNKDRGIEMDDDFDADTFDVSEDSGDDDVEDEEEMNLDSKMGETGDGSQVVDEKLWDKDEDGKPDTSVDKYESGPSVKETDSGSRELRAKDDSALEVEESGEMDDDESDGHSKEDKEPSISDDDENAVDMNLDKGNAFEDPTGIQFHEEEKNLEDVSMDEPKGSDVMDGTDSDPTRSDEEMNDEDENSSPIDHINDENSLELDENTETKGEEDAENANMDLDASKETLQSSKIESVEYPAEQAGLAEPLGDPHNIDSNADPEMHWANSSDMNAGIAPSRNLPCNEVPKIELSLPDLNDGSRLSSDQPKPQTLQVDTSPMQSTQTNPYRSIGHAMEEWQERAKVSVDPQEHQPVAHDDIVDKNADEYRYVSEAEKSTTQALGAATSDQIKSSAEGNKSTAEEGYVRKKDVDRNDVLEENSETHHLKANQASIPRQKVDEELVNAVVDIDASMEEMEETNLESLSGDMVSFRSSYMDEKILPLANFMNDKALSKSMDIEEISDQTMHKAILDWKRYELVTTRLSQELAEQLRLVMEPTLASKLQGDYRTGKRINMKKVIPYIASHFRKDKIWLRRTRPNKRDYQVVVAIDDSRSMSESLCGNVAIEALVTVCRAMSQLEVGQFAVASFGEKGNIKLLHDFDQPFTGEAGVKMISSLSFKQDNTIADEPMVDLLKYLNNMLDTAVAKARTPSGQNPLHQLILIIADGRFHEKENLKRCVRNVLNRKRMIAFILLDSPQESIMDLMEASFEGEKLSFTKYLNSFPFPYYIVLKNLEALPRTLADLLRQWFELMQSISE